MNMTLNRFDKILLNLIYAPILPITLFLATWWISMNWIDDVRILLWALSGLVIGVLVDFRLYRCWLKVNYRRHPVFTSLIYLFYSICIFGVFMGMPIFNILLGVVTGSYAARKAIVLGYSQEATNRLIANIALTTTILLAVMFVCSAAIALHDPYTAANLRGMLGLPVNPSQKVIWLIIIVGGSLGLLIQYLLVCSIGIWTLKRYHRLVE